MALRVTTSGGSLRTPREVVGNVIRIGGHPSSEVSLPGLGERVLLLFVSRQGVHGRRLDDANLRKRFDAVEELRFTIGPYRIIARREELTDDRGSLRSNLSPAVVIEGRSRKEAKLSRPITLIGRSELSDIALRHRGVSRVHAALLWDGAELTVVDLFSANGTQVDGSKTDYVPLSHGQVLTIDDVTLRVRTPGRELTSDLPPEAPSTGAMPPTGPLIDAITQDLPGENPLEAVAPVDEATQPYRESQPDPATELIPKAEMEALETQSPNSASEPYADELSIDWELAADLQQSHATASLPNAETSGEITSDEPGLDKGAAELNRFAQDEALAGPIGIDDAWAPLEAPQSDTAPRTEAELWEDLLGADLKEDATLPPENAVDVLPEPVSETEPDALIEQLSENASDPGENELTIDWELVADLQPSDPISLESTGPPAEISIDEPQPDDGTAELNRSELAETTESDERVAPPESFANDAAPQAQAEPWEDLLAADLPENAGSDARVTDVSPELVFEIEPSALVEQQPSTATELGAEELTIDWEPASDLEPPDAVSLPSAEPSADIGIEEPEPDDIGTGLDPLGREENLAEQIEGDSGFAPLEVLASDIRSPEKAESWEDSLTADLQEDAMLRPVDDDDVSTGEFYDDLPVFHRNPRNETVTDEPVSDERLGDAADNLVADDVISAYEPSKDDSIDDDAKRRTAGDLITTAPTRDDATTNELELHVSKTNQTELPWTELRDADPDAAGLGDAELNEPDLIDSDLIDTELEDSEGSNNQLAPQLPLDLDTIDFADTIEPDGSAPKEAASVEEPLAIIDEEQFPSDFGGVRSTELGADSTDVGPDVLEMLESPDLEGEAVSPTGNASQEQSFEGPKGFRPEVTEPTVDYMANLTRFHERESMSLTRKVLLLLGASAIVAILAVLGYWAYSTFLSA